MKKINSANDGTDNYMHKQVHVIIMPLPGLPWLLDNSQERTQTKDKITIWKKNVHFCEEKLAVLVFKYMYINLYIPLTNNNRKMLNKHKIKIITCIYVYNIPKFENYLMLRTPTLVQ